MQRVGVVLIGCQNSPARTFRRLNFPGLILLPGVEDFGIDFHLSGRVAHGATVANVMLKHNLMAGTTRHRLLLAQTNNGRFRLYPASKSDLAAASTCEWSLRAGRPIYRFWSAPDRWLPRRKS